LKLPASAPAPARIVLDTNVVLDWMVFADPRSDLLVRWLLAGRLHWSATAAMRAELADVLPRPALRRWQPDVDRVLADFDRLAMLEAAAPAALDLHCKDSDDQMFIDLAVSVRARWLFSCDRAVLDLAGRARRWGVEIIRPAEWARGRRFCDRDPGFESPNRPRPAGPARPKLPRKESGRPKPP
jgi:predicted nucleic acid-binding protein